MTQAQEAKARSRLFGFLKKLFIGEPGLSLEERERLERVLSPCWKLPTLDQMVKRMIIENEKLQDISISKDSKLYELSQTYPLAFLSFAEEVNDLRRYAFLKYTEVYGAGAKKGEELAKTAGKMMYKDVKIFDLSTNVDRIPSILAEIKEQLEVLKEYLKEYRSLESMYTFINTEIKIIEMKYQRFKELKNEFDQELEAGTQKPSGKSRENPDRLPS